MTESADSLAGGRRRGWGALALVFLVAFAARAGFGLYSAPGGDVASLTFDDERWYWALGESYARGDGLIGEFGHRAERMPLYPWFLSWFAGAAGGPGLARGVQWALGALAAPLTYLLAARVGRFPLVAGLIVACDPALAGSASLLLTETLHATALAALWWAAFPLSRAGRDSVKRWLAVAALAVASVYLREASCAFIGLLAIYLVAARRDRRAAWGALAVVAIVAAALLPWAYRNQRVLGSWYWLTTRGGISLYDGVRPGASGTGDLADVKNSPEVAGLSEAAWDRHFRAAARAAIRDEPGRILRLAPVKLARTWSPVLHAAEYDSGLVRLLFAAWYVPLYALVIVGVWGYRRQWSAWIYLLLPAIGVTLLHAVFVGSVRYRVAAIPALAVLAAWGLERLISMCRRSPMPRQEAT